MWPLSVLRSVGFGDICPNHEEAPFIGKIFLILFSLSSLGIFSQVDDYGFLITPYRKIEKGKLTDQIDYLRADEESEHYVIPADTPVEKSKITEDRVLARHRNDVKWIPDTCKFMLCGERPKATGVIEINQLTKG